MTKPTVPFGSIYRRGKRGTFQFENRRHGIIPTSLKTADPEEAVQRALERFGYLQYRDDGRQHEAVLQHLEMSSKKARKLPHHRVRLDEVNGQYVKILKRVGKRKGKLHVDADSQMPLSPNTLRAVLVIVRRFNSWL